MISAMSRHESLGRVGGELLFDHDHETRCVKSGEGAGGGIVKKDKTTHAAPLLCAK